MGGSNQPDIDALVKQIIAGRNPSELLEDLRRGRILDSLRTGSFQQHVNKPVAVAAPLDEPLLLTIKVELEDSEPLIWRRLQVRTDMALDAFHDVLQDAMGWSNSHLHRFHIPGDRNYFLNEFDVGEGENGTPETDVRLDQILRAKGDGLNYEYDLGDGWEHRIVVEEVRTATPDDKVANCVAGGRRCPAEDVGGIGFFNDLAAELRRVKNPQLLSGEFEDLAHWLPADYDPDDFSVEDANFALSMSGTGGASAILDVAADGVQRAPEFEALVGRCPRHLIGELILLSSEALRAAPATDVELREQLRPFQTMLDLADPDGIPLTKAGWLAPDACEHVWNESGLNWGYGKGNREQHTPEVSQLRRDCVTLKLLRKNRERLLLTPLGRKAGADVGVLSSVIAGSLLRGETEMDRDANVLALLLLAAGRPFERRDDFEDQVANLLTEIGWRTGDYAEAPVHRHELRLYRIERIVAGDPNAAFRWTGPVGSAGARQLAKEALWPDA
ncbi:plasmid pRiA4b ORF-3 family protein [Yimella sp. RIT 621]|uniref:plasmid pRiA4b ORF-3 family protein n=1 Tax=Yimella sp. RIT 621 TaxID=2510323 RepID=UPI00101D11E7|nr:plasmid pRiA4b ORF-3 family protein [Yimella sp. RIT 621]RYG76404.1 plasmid pRiA4b ORF-3 family protein [Yimella sp. RIT 621]